MRNELLNGNLPLISPEKFQEYLGTELMPTMEALWSSLWHNYCANEGSTSSIFWLKLFGAENTEKYIEVIKELIKKGWIETDTNEAFSSIKLSSIKLLEFVSPAELEEIRFAKRFDKYLPVTNKSTQHGVAKVRLNGTSSAKTLQRPGMEIGAKSEFHFDQLSILNNLDAIVEEVNKGIVKTLAKSTKVDSANYGNVSKEIVEYIATNKITCNMGSNHVDSRGRAIKTGLAKVFNPIGYKTARANLVIPAKHRKKATVAGRDAIYLFVAELNGYKSGTVEGKLAFGEKCWVNETVPHELHEAMWAKRLYKELYGFMASQIEGTDYYWSTPIELDASASLLQYVGVLTNDELLMRMTNVVSDGELSDPWNHVEGVTRKLTKPVIMRWCYGSSKTAAATLDALGLDYTTEDVIRLDSGLHGKGYGVANKLKEFIIGNAVMQPEMNPVVWGETLTVPCNRHITHGVKPVFYSAVDSKGRTVKVTHWDTVKTPDLKSFRRWTMTGLIHSLDSRVIDQVMQSVSWGIDIHDAVIVNPEDALTVRQAYAAAMESIHADRETILNEYFVSVGITGTAKAKKEWDELKALITPLNEPFKCSMWAVK